MSTLQVLNSIKKIEGWLHESEADLLMSCTLKACIDLQPPHSIVEVGSYHGKSTVVLGKIAKSFFPQCKIYAIDPHEGVVGAIDRGLASLPASLEKFKKNIDNEGLSDVVELIKDYSYKVKWELPVSFLFIDGLHDYLNVARDFWHFAKWVRPGGYVAFHDYHDYYPGVKTFVDELLEGKRYKRISMVYSLIVLQKL